VTPNLLTIARRIIWVPQLRPFTLVRVNAPYRKSRALVPTLVLPMSIESSQVADDEYPAPRFNGISLFIPIVVAAVTPPTPIESKIATKKIF
jgi:hypothetical protein